MRKVLLQNPVKNLGETLVEIPNTILRIWNRERIAVAIQEEIPEEFQGTKIYFDRNSNTLRLGVQNKAVTYHMFGVGLAIQKVRERVCRLGIVHRPFMVSKWSMTKIYVRDKFSIFLCELTPKKGKDDIEKRLSLFFEVLKNPKLL